jgi:hypothetical protein
MKVSCTPSDKMSGFMMRRRGQGISKRNNYGNE